MSSVQAFGCACLRGSRRALEARFLVPATLFAKAQALYHISSRCGTQEPFQYSWLLAAGQLGHHDSWVHEREHGDVKGALLSRISIT